MSQAPHVVVLGSCTVDLVFQMPRLPLPGETLFADSVGLFPGGKGLNQAIAARRLGARASVIGCVGADALAEVLRRALLVDGVDVGNLSVHETVGTGIAVPIVLPGGGNSILAAPRANLALPLDAIEEARPALASADCFLAQFESPMWAVIAAARIVHDAGGRVILNPAPARAIPDELWPLLDVLVVNEVEAEALAPGLAGPTEQAEALAAHGPSLVVVTLGPEGAVYWSAGQNGATSVFPVATVVDTVGAGDAFCGALAVALAEGSTVGAAVGFASAVAGISVTRAGAAPSYPTRAELVAALDVVLAGEPFSPHPRR